MPADITAFTCSSCRLNTFRIALRTAVSQTFFTADVMILYMHIKHW